MKNAARLLLSAALACSLGGCLQNLSDADLSDPGIKARLEASLQAQKGLDLRYVTIDVHSRIVTISGIVSSWNDKQTVERIVHRTPGVDQAVINLVIQE